MPFSHSKRKSTHERRGNICVKEQESKHDGAKVPSDFHLVSVPDKDQWSPAEAHSNLRRNSGEKHPFKGIGWRNSRLKNWVFSVASHWEGLKETRALGEMGKNATCFLLNKSRWLCASGGWGGQDCQLNENVWGLEWNEVMIVGSTTTTAVAVDSTCWQKFSPLAKSPIAQRRKTCGMNKKAHCPLDLLTLPFPVTQTRCFAKNCVSRGVSFYRTTWIILISKSSF